MQQSVRCKKCGMQEVRNARSAVCKTCGVQLSRLSPASWQTPCAAGCCAAAGGRGSCCRRWRGGGRGRGASVSDVCNQTVAQGAHVASASTSNSCATMPAGKASRGTAAEGHGPPKCEHPQAAQQSAARHPPLVRIELFQLMEAAALQRSSRKSSRNDLLLLSVGGSCRDVGWTRRRRASSQNGTASYDRAIVFHRCARAVNQGCPRTCWQKRWGMPSTSMAGLLRCSLQMR